MNKWFKKFVCVGAACVLGMALFAGCGADKKDNASNAEVLKVGVTAGPHAEIMDEVKKVAAKRGMKIEVVEFSDFVQPNMALDNKEIAINSYQHEPFLKHQIKDRGYKLTPVGKTVIYPMGIYSSKIKSLSEIKDGATVPIPNDPTNGGRALKLLEAAGLIKLKDGVGYEAMVVDIVSNPKNLVIQEMEAAQITRALQDVDFAVVNTNYAIAAGLVPTKDALVIESSDSPYVNLIVVRTEDKDKPFVKEFVSAYQSDEIKTFINDHFKGSVVVGW